MNKKKCEICEYSTSKINSFHRYDFDKKYSMCCQCKTSFNENIILPKLSELITKLNFPQLTLKRDCKGTLSFLIKYSNDVKVTIEHLNEIFDREFENFKKLTKNAKPFENIEVYNLDGTFYCFTSFKNMNRLLKNERVEKISDGKIKFKQQMDDSMHSLVIKQTNNKKNECINCGKNE